MENSLLSTNYNKRLDMQITTTELLSLVLEYPVIEISDCVEDNELTYKLEEGIKYFQWQSINLDTLGRLHKEWCIKNNYILKSFISSEKGFCIIETLIGEDKIIDVKIEDTELEAIIKATKWIANEKGLLLCK